MGRAAGGVRGISLEGDDEVVGLEIPRPDATILTVSERAQGKRSPLEDYRLQSRGGKGIITMKVGERTGGVVGIAQVTESDELMLVTDRGRLIRMRVDDMRVTGRNTQGVKMLNLDEGERVVSMARVAEGDLSESADGEADEPVGDEPGAPVEPSDS